MATNIAVIPTLRDILTKNKSKLGLLAEKLIAQETLEGEELEEIFSEIAPKPAAEVKPTPTPVPIKPLAETKPEEKPKKIGKKAKEGKMDNAKYFG